GPRHRALLNPHQQPRSVIAAELTTAHGSDDVDGGGWDSAILPRPKQQRHAIAETEQLAAPKANLSDFRSCGLDGSHGIVHVSASRLEGSEAQLRLQKPGTLLRRVCKEFQCSIQVILGLVKRSQHD